MGSTNRTTNYELSQFVGNDKPAWLSDYNGDMAKIDTAIKARSVEAGAAQTTADTANGKADALDTRMGTAENNITALQNASTADHTQIATNTSNISKNAQDIVQLDAKIGHTQITIGDHTVTGAIATLASQGGVEADNVTYDNTTSGLTADDVQEAIDELAARPTVAEASDVTFDNTGTTLQATNVEDAIKEVASATPQTSETVRYTGGYIQYYDGTQWINWVAPAGASLTEIIPVLTSNDSAQSTVGLVSSTAAQTMNTSQAYYAFDRAQPGTPLVKMDGNTITFTFNEATLVNVLRGYIQSSNGASATANLEVTTDGSTWTSVKTQGTTAMTKNWDLLNVEINTVITGFRIKGGNGAVALLNVYGLNAYLKSV